MNHTYIEKYEYQNKVFDPSKPQRRPSQLLQEEASFVGGGLAIDENEAAAYNYTPEIVLHVNLAIHTGRPLLVRGPSGSGKSSLAVSVAYVLGRPYYQEVITSHTRARDLLWSFDAVARLGDAQARSQGKDDVVTEAGSVDRKLDRARYIRPGILWWAFDRDSALRRGMPQGTSRIQRPEDPSRLPGEGVAVVLLDEIDKADPDVPNDLLEPIGSMRFRVEEIDTLIERPADQGRPLIFITTNNERELPKAFLRRCLILDLPPPDAERLEAIAMARWPTDDPDERQLYREIAVIVAPPPKTDAMVSPVLLEGSASGRVDSLPLPLRPQPSSILGSTAEYLDTVLACLKLKVTPKDEDVWPLIMKTTLLKPNEAAPTR